MCGIAGIFSFDQSDRGQAVKKMTDAMSHRGPDADGFFVDEFIALGHRRLSIIDLSEAANQPFTDNSGRYNIIFNGEIYNFRELKSQIRNYHFKTNSDTEVLLAGYLQWGTRCVNYLKGMFTFAIWDSLNRELFLARDRFGVKPLYYYKDENVFLFASEVRAILKSGLVNPTLNGDAIREFFSYQSITSPVTIINEIKQLEAGCSMLVRSRKLTIESYWDITNPETEHEYSDAESIRKELRKLLYQSVERRLVSDVPLGAFLSGGIDSSILVGIMSELNTSRVNTFTVAFDEKDFDESAYAAIIARKFNTSHNEVLLKPSVFLDEMQNAMHSMDTPSGDGINTYVVSKAIRKSGLIVALSGIGGDELFAGYHSFLQWNRLANARKYWALASPVRQAVSAALAFSDSGKMNRMRQILRSEKITIENAYPALRTVLSAEQLRQILNFPNGNPGIIDKILFDKRAAIASFPLLSQYSIAEFYGYTQNTLLKDTDQMSMAVSLEVREPFFDHELVEFVLGVPDQFKYPHHPKQLLTESLEGLLPPEIIHRKKQGFVLPWNHWLRNELKEFCDGQIKNISKREFINGKELNRLWERFQNGDKSIRWMDPWLFVVLENWLENNGVQ